MIRLSRLADYGVALMTEVATDRRAMSTAHAVAEATGLPLPTVSKLLSAFARAGLLKAVRGANGGYCLARRPEAISVAEIVSAVDGPIALTQCIEHGPGHCDVEALCQTRRGFRILNDAVRNAFEAVTLADLIEPPLVPLSAARLATGGGQGMAG